MMRRYHPYWMRFAQADPWDGSYDLAGPQSFNRYSYTGNDPVNFTDPAGLAGAPYNGGGGRAYNPDPWGGDYVIPASQNGWGGMHSLSPLRGVELTLTRSYVLWAGDFGHEFAEYTSLNQHPSMQGPPKAGPYPETPAQRARRERREREKERQRRQRLYDDCFHERMKGPMAGLREVMNFNLTMYMLTLGLTPGDLTSRMQVSIVPLYSWRRDVLNYEKNTLGPAREKAKAECKKEAGL
jgi:hypothetical protein